MTLAVPTSSLHRALGLGLALALTFGGTVGTGILRLPGTVAAALGDPAWIIFVWVMGGAYATIGAISVAELAAMMPTAGGFYVYARRSFGAGAGFVVGWNDWLINCLALATASMTAGDFIGALDPRFAGHSQGIGLAVLGTFAALHWIGIRIGSRVQMTISATVGILLVVLAFGCFTVSATIDPAMAVQSSPSFSPIMSLGTLAIFAVAFRSVLYTYDGWYTGIYVAEETVDAARTLPRAIIGGALIITALYVFINAGFLHVLPMSVLSESKLPAADAARVIFPRGGGEFVTVVSLLTILSLINAILLSSPRILYALGRDGFLVSRATSVSDSGTPRVALLITSGASALLLLSGTLAQLIAIGAVIFVLNYLSAYVGVFVLRVREPDTARPFRAWGFPVTTGLALLGSITFIVVAVLEDWRSGVFALALIAIAAPTYWWASRRLVARA